MKKLIQHLKKHAASMERVDTILGFGFGRLHFKELDDAAILLETEHPQRNIIQHLTCLAIQKILEQEQGNKIKIQTQDPDYCPYFTLVLRG